MVNVMHLDFGAFLNTLPIMGYGMAGIFIVILTIMLSVKIMTVLTGKKQNNQ